MVEKGRVPVTVLSGFLGSGKTTFLNSILVDDRFSDAVVIVNEFGDVAIDHALIETSIDDPILLSSGCICCSIRGDLRDTLLLLRSRAELNEIPQFSRVIVETSGVSDPGPILATLLDDRELLRSFELSGLLVTVDAVNVASNLSRFEEVQRQIVLADCLLITKTDIASEDQARAARDLVSGINPVAAIHDVRRDQVDADALLRAAGAHAALAPPVEAAGHHTHQHRQSHFSSTAVRRADPVEWSALATWLQSLLSLRDGILRVKGFVRITESDFPVVLHCVGQTLYPPVVLDHWPDDERETRLVFIGNDPCLPDLQKAMDAALAS
ncbi:MAG: CobW family GTP-binding protein [Pseudolabrys sp.]